ncbi:hypothetical protein SEA_CHISANAKITSUNE_17 [Gordonia phage ChisanaKitsune]|uniref:Uncharacterized protein n=1 Tax=Gordonia phage ChisanaKitsune TaxID=2871538 RepID=A0AAE7XGX5_9CAUD|nr:hypothetical protein PQD15_gp017 [Gordonia phage ChisanaKitsune]QZE10788.1 hypothetical protein SEA_CHISANAKITSUNE_17 [Gordonia phage ChisanaKitsune]
MSDIPEKLPKIKNSKVVYHGASDTYYVVANYDDDNDSVPDLMIRIERAGRYLDDTDTREEMARWLHDRIEELAHAQGQVAVERKTGTREQPVGGDETSG